MARKNKPPLDPRIVAAQARKEKAAALFERWYSRMRRAVNAMEKARQAVVNANRLIDRVSHELAGDGGA